MSQGWRENTTAERAPWKKSNPVKNSNYEQRKSTGKQYVEIRYANILVRTTVVGCLIDFAENYIWSYL